MKKTVITLLSAAIILTSLTSCTLVFDSIGILKNTETDVNSDSRPKETEAPASANAYTNQTDIESYMHYLVSYFHEPYQQGDDISKNNLLYLSFLFCFANKDSLDFVKTNEEKRSMRIPGEELERIAGNLISHSGDLSVYRLSMENSSDFYSEETDTYIVSYARGYWNGDPYYLSFDESGKIKKPQITETATEISVIVEICYAPNLGIYRNARKAEYKFDKVIDGDSLFYRLSSVKELS